MRRESPAGKLVNLDGVMMEPSDTAIKLMVVASRALAEAGHGLIHWFTVPGTAGELAGQCEVCGPCASIRFKTGEVTKKSDVVLRLAADPCEPAKEIGSYAGLALSLN